MEEEAPPNKDKLKEQVRLKIEIMRLAAIYALSMGGGTISMIKDGPDTGREIAFTAFGFIVSAGVLIYARKVFKETTKIIHEL